MKAIVKDIPLDTFKKDKEDWFYFTENHRYFVGKTIDVMQKFGYKNWFWNINSDNDEDYHNFHKSWLTFIKD
jgi:hypothetical protein